MNAIELCEYWVEHHVATPEGFVVAIDGAHFDMETLDHNLTTALALAGAVVESKSDVLAGDVCTHIFGGHYAATIAVRRPLAEVAGSSLAALSTAVTALQFGPGPSEIARRHAERTSGRFVRFRGKDAAVGDITVGELLERTAVEAVYELGGATLNSDALVTTFDHVRPQFDKGRIVLLVCPRADGSFQPFEVRSPARCGCEMGLVH